jgi:group I intron endonuclease
MSNEENYFVYVHVNKINRKCYVGITKDISKRWGKNGDGYKKLKTKGCFANAIEKYGWDNFEHIILENNITFTQAKYLEKLYIKELDAFVPNGYNLTAGGDGLENYHHSEETRKRISELQIGRISPRKGCKLTDKQKKKISAGNKGKIRTEEFKVNVSKNMKGRKFSEESKKKMSEARIGMKFSDEHKKHLSESKKKFFSTKEGKESASKRASKPVIQFDKNGNEIGRYKSASEAKRITGICQINAVCNGFRKNAGGYKWKWEEAI